MNTVQKMLLRPQSIRSLFNVGFDRVMITTLCVILTSITGLEMANISSNNIVTHSVFKRLSGAQKCFGPLGCFIKDDFYKFPDRPVNIFPADRDSINTRFALYTRKNRLGSKYKPHFIQANKFDSITNSHFDSSYPVKFLIHGYLDKASAPWVNTLGNALLDAEDMSVIVVDWTGGNGLGYVQSTANTWVVGGEVALLIQFLKEKFKVSLDRVHILGHSLGAHIAGYAGSRLDGKIARITGLDPAEPFFQYMPEYVRLDPKDAKFVDVIHSDAKSILQFGTAMIQPVGHFDFYPNGGEYQPGCEMYTRLSNLKLDNTFEAARHLVACNHMRAIYLYTESITTGCAFLAHECESYNAFLRGECIKCGQDGSKCASMGHRSFMSHPAPTSAVNRKFYLKTAAKAPFCVNQYAVRMNLADDRRKKDEKGMLFVTLLGEKASVKEHQLNEGIGDLVHGKSYTFIVTSPRPLGRVTSAMFYWKNGLNLERLCAWNCNKPYILLRSIHVEPLDVQPEKRRLAKGTTLCPSVQQPLPPKTIIKLYSNTKCTF